MYSFGAMLSFTIAHVAVVAVAPAAGGVGARWVPPLNFRLAQCKVPLTAISGGWGRLVRG